MNKSGFFKRKKNKFSQISNIVLHDKNLSLKSKGLYSIIQSYITIPDFVLYKNMLINQSKEGKRAFETAWKELKDNGYLVQERHNSKEGFYYVYDLLDEPSPCIHYADVGNPCMGNVGDIINTNYNNTDNNNTNNLIGNENTISFNKLLKYNINLSYIEDIDSSIKIINYYCSKYKNIYNRELKYTKETWINMLKNILNNDTGSSNDNIKIFKNAIDKHFNTNYKYKEMYLLHNFVGKVKDNRLYESDILQEV